MLWLVWRQKVRLDEQVEQGIGSFAGAMEKMFSGGHLGKLLVNVSAPAAPDAAPAPQPVASAASA